MSRTQAVDDAYIKKELQIMGKALGGLRWVQGPGGNCSVKSRDDLWVKASGTRFAEVAEQGGHARVPLAVARLALGGDEEAGSTLFAVTPRPSLETYFHALGARVVAHTHALGALLYACSTAPFEREVEPGVVSIPYVPPGRGVALALRDVLAAHEPEAEQVCILRSHGIVAYADTAERAVELTARFDERARAQAERAGPLPPFEPQVEAYLGSAEQLVEGGTFRTLPERTVRESGQPRYLFPDAPVCASVVLVDSLGDLRARAAEALRSLQRACLVVDANGRRIAVAKTATQLSQTCEVAAAHDWLEDALRARNVAGYLPVDEPARILNMPSEQYRIQLAGAGS